MPRFYVRSTFVVVRSIRLRVDCRYRPFYDGPTTTHHVPLHCVPTHVHTFYRILVHILVDVVAVFAYHGPFPTVYLLFCSRGGRRFVVTHSFPLRYGLISHLPRPFVHLLILRSITVPVVRYITRFVHTHAVDLRYCSLRTTDYRYV